MRFFLATAHLNSFFSGIFQFATPTMSSKKTLQCLSAPRNRYAPAEARAPLTAEEKKDKRATSKENQEKIDAAVGETHLFVCLTCFQNIFKGNGGRIPTQRLSSSANSLTRSRGISSTFFFKAVRTWSITMRSQTPIMHSSLRRRRNVETVCDAS